MCLERCDQCVGWRGGHFRLASSMKTSQLLQRLAYLGLGLVWGALSGYLSVYDLQQIGMFIWPALVFAGFALVLAAMILGMSWRQFVIQLFLFLGIYWAVIFSLPSFALLMAGGAALVGVSLSWGLPLKHGYRILVWGVFLQLIAGGMFDLFRDQILSDLQQFSESWLYQGREPVGGSARVLVFLWQTIMMTAITLQLYTERCYRQTLAAQEVASLDHDHPSSP